MAKRVGVILSGCGVMDGSEIHEAVSTMLAIDKAGAQIVCLAPNKDQIDVVNHVSSTPQGERRGVMVEAARIARGEIRDIAQVTAADLDAVVIPGGYGAAKNLCTFASDGPACKVDPSVQKLLRDLHAAKKPIGALCIAPAVLAAVFKDVRPELTIGTDEGTAKALEKMGAKHVPTPVSDIVVDRKNRLVTNACYMLATRISEVAAGAEKVVKAVLEMA